MASWRGGCARTRGWSSCERVNARQLSAEHVPEPVSLIVCDVSFIGLTLVLPAALRLAAPRR